MLYVSCRDHFHCASEPRLTRLSNDIRREPFLSKKAFQRRSIFSGEAKPLPYLLAHGPNVEQCHRGTTKTSHSTASVGRNCKSDIAMTAPGSTHTYDWAFPDF